MNHMNLKLLLINVHIFSIHIQNFIYIIQRRKTEIQSCRFISYFIYTFNNDTYT